jgi:hypothetical protein
MRGERITEIAIELEPRTRLRVSLGRLRTRLRRLLARLRRSFPSGRKGRRQARRSDPTVAHARGRDGRNSEL